MPSVRNSRKSNSRWSSSDVRVDPEAGHHDVAERSVVAQDHQLEVLARPRLVLDQRRLELGRLRVDVGEDPVEAAVLVDQLRRRLLADAGNAGQVVARIAAQRRVLRVQRRRDPGLLLDAGLVVERVVADAAPVVEDLHMRVDDQLIAVAIARHDDHVVTVGDQQVDGGGDQVVGFPAGAVDRGDPDRVEHLADEAHLLAEDVGRRCALRLVLGLRLVTERRLGPVECHQHAVGLVVLQHVDQHRREPEHGVGHLTAGGGHVGREREERAVGERVAVDDEVGPHCSQSLQRRVITRRRVATTRRGCGRPRHACACARSSPSVG